MGTTRSARPRRATRDALTLRWVKPARQARSRDTQERIVEAAQRLLARGRSWDELTVAELVAEAETSVGAFYNRFADKDALLHVLQLALYREGTATAAQAQVLAAGAAVPFDVLVRAFVALAVTSYRQQFGLRRALLARMHAGGELRDRAVELTRDTCERLTDVLAPRFPSRERREVRAAVDVAHRLVYGLLDQNLTFEERPTGRALGDAALVDELSLAIGAYLERRLGPPGTEKE